MARKTIAKKMLPARYYELRRLSTLVASEESGNVSSRPPTPSERAFHKLTDAVFETPAAGLPGLCELAVIGYHWADKWEDGELQGLDPAEVIATRSLVELLHAVLVQADALENADLSIRSEAAKAA